MLKSCAIVPSYNGLVSFSLWPISLSLFCRLGHRSVDCHRDRRVVDGKPATACVRSLICGDPSRASDNAGMRRTDPIRSRTMATRVFLPRVVDRKRPVSPATSANFEQWPRASEHRDFFSAFRVRTRDPPTNAPKGHLRRATERPPALRRRFRGTRELAWVARVARDDHEAHQERARARAV